MNKVFTIFFLTCFHFCFSQNLTVFYEAKFKPDSLNSNLIITTEPFVLCIKGKQSVYKSYNLHRRDSIVNVKKNASLAELMLATEGLPSPSTTTKFFKNNDKINLVSRLLNLEYIYEYPKPINEWEILDEHKKFDGNTLTKATLDYAGRVWVAWFSNDIPISNGPDVFGGLPGLIFEIKDKTNSYHFKLIGLKQGLFDYWETPSLEAKEISAKNYRKIKENYRQNPIIQMQAMGAVIDEENRKKIMDAYREKRKRNNNKMELKREY